MPAPFYKPALAQSEVAAVYQALDRIPIERSCVKRTECCQFLLTGKTPMLTKGEAAYAAQGVRSAGWKTLPEREDGVCPLLASNGKCRIYSHRPFGCRTHFCQPAGGPYERKAVLDLIRRLEVVDAKLGGDGPRPLPAAIEEALESMPGNSAR